MKPLCPAVNINIGACSMDRSGGACTFLLQAIKAGGDAFEIGTVALNAFSGRAHLRINVVFTTPNGTQAALSFATSLSAGLDPEISLIAPQTVPYPLALDRPPVATEFTLQKLRQLTAFISADLRLYVCLCRDPLDGLLRLLPEQVPVICGVRRPPFFMPFTRSGALAEALRRYGRKVIQVTCR